MIRVFTSKTQVLGETGEQAAVVWLESKGYVIRDRNIAGKYGEIDIVATKEGIVYFFEVKAGKSGSWFNPAENLTKAKLAKFLKSVEYYCLRNRVREYRVQGIVVSFTKDVPTLEILDIFWYYAEAHLSGCSISVVYMFWEHEGRVRFPAPRHAVIVADWRFLKNWYDRNIAGLV